MCRSIKTLRGPGHSLLREDAVAAALQYVRKISGYRQPSQSNTRAFNAAVEEIATASMKLLHSLGPRGA